MPPATPRRAAGCADLCSIFRTESSQAANVSKFTIFFRAPPLGVFALSKKGERELKSEKTFTTNLAAIMNNATFHNELDKIITFSRAVLRVFLIHTTLAGTHKYLDYVEYINIGPGSRRQTYP